MDGMDAVVVGIEYELTLLIRGYKSYQRAMPEGQTYCRSAYLLLSRLEAEHPLSLRELATAFALDLSTINRQVKALHNDHLVEFVLDPRGSAIRKVQPTKEGLARLENDRARNRQALAEALQEWTPAELQNLVAQLTKLNLTIERLQDVPWPRSTSNPPRAGGGPA
jgi:DNA-binding MarR family transcriptional regulator